jgi:acyl-CoA synthetase (AMP-forming)/AMP-acid ligase II
MTEEIQATEEDTPVDLLAAHAEAQPDKPAIIDDRPDGTCIVWRYAELNDRANRLANAMYDIGVRPGDKVVWCGKNSPQLVVAGFASRKIGAVSVPLNYRLTPDEAAFVVDNSDALFVWVDAEFAGLFTAIQKDTPKVNHIAVFDGLPKDGMMAGNEWAAAFSSKAPDVQDRGELQTMIYTSGTTGKPKGAVRNVVGDPDQTKAMLDLVGYQPDDVYLTTGPIYHSGPGGFMGLAFLLGNTVILQRKFDPEDWLRLVEKYKVTSTFAAPTPIRMVCKLPDDVKSRYDRGSMRIMIANAAPWSLSLKKEYIESFSPESLYEVYGSTELGVDTILEPEDQLRKPGSCGKAAPGVEIVLFDPFGETITEPNVPGELYLRSKNAYNAYYKAADKFEADRRGSYHTVGDIAYRDEEGFYYICDRKKDMIISGGMNIYPAEIESALEAYEKIYEAAVFGIPSEEWGESVHAVVVVSPGTTLTEAEVIEFSRQHLAGYKIPRSVSFIDELPRTGSGKVLKRVLREPFWKEADTNI